MFIDSYNRFSSAQAIASAASTNVIDLGAERDIGNGEPMAVVVLVTTELDDADGDETYTVTVQTDADEAFGSATTVVAATSMARGSAAGTRFVIAIPAGVQTERYLRLLYAVGGTTPTGNVTAWLAPLSMLGVSGESRYYPNNYTVS